MPKVQSRCVSPWLSTVVLTVLMCWSAHSVQADDPAASGSTSSSAPALPIPASPPPVSSSPLLSSPNATRPNAAQTKAHVQDVQPGEQVIQIVSPHSKINMRNLDSRILELSNRIKVVDGFDADKITVKALSPHRVRLHAENPGVTTVKLIDEFDNLYVADVFIEPDTRELEAYLERLFPGSAIEVVGIRDGVVLRGWVTRPSQIPEIMSIAEQFYEIVHPQLTVAGSSQVQLHVKVMEVQRSKLRQLGVNFDISGSHFVFGSTVGTLLKANSQFNLSVFGGGKEFNALVEALVTDSLAKILAEPVLVTTSGRPASMLSGGKFPFPVPQALGVNTIQWENYGVSLEAVPIVLGEGRLRLDLAPEVSEQDLSRATTISGTTVPALSVRRVNTQVEMRFGETLLIGGLISSRRVASNKKIPLLGDMPVVGAFFSRKRYEMAETELVFLITPQLVAPMAPHQVPPGGPGLQSTDPVDRELYLDGLLEVPNFGPVCPNCPPAGELIYPGGPIPGGEGCQPMPMPMQPMPMQPTFPQLGSNEETISREILPASATTPAKPGSRTTVTNPFRSGSTRSEPAPIQEKTVREAPVSSTILQTSGTFEEPRTTPPKTRTSIFEARSLPGLIAPKSPKTGASK